MEAVKLQNVSFGYTGENRRNGIHNVNLTVKQGECVLLAGLSGCGKSTVLRLINGLAPYFYEGTLEGSIELAGKRVDEIPFADISKICGSVFQNPRSQFFYMNTSSEIAFGCENQGIPTSEIESRVEKSIVQLGIQKLQNRNIMRLSGGKKQKIAFASVYAGQPDIYVLDEPSANLDFHAIEEITRILKKLKKQGKTIIIAEHRLYYLMELADRVCYIKDGEIAEEYSIDQFKNIPQIELRKKGLRVIDYNDLYNETVKVPDTKQTIQKYLCMSNVSSKYMVAGRPALYIKECQLPLYEKIAIIGHNGAGKSTFMNGLCGIDKNVRGNYSEENTNYSFKKRCRESFEVFQEVNHQLFTNSVEDEISLGTKIAHGKSKEELMDMLGLKEYANTHPMALSGGQKQRVAIASALYSGRQLICLDEPTSGLDYQQMEKVAALIDQVQKETDLILVITHDLEFILKTCTYIVHIENGEIMEQYSLDKKGKEKLFQFFN